MIHCIGISCRAFPSLERGKQPGKWHFLKIRKLSYIFPFDSFCSFFPAGDKFWLWINVRSMYIRACICKGCGGNVLTVTFLLFPAFRSHPIFCCGKDCFHLHSLRCEDLLRPDCSPWPRNRFIECTIYYARIGRSPFTTSRRQTRLSLLFLWIARAWNCRSRRRDIRRYKCFRPRALCKLRSCSPPFFKDDNFYFILSAWDEHCAERLQKHGRENGRNPFSPTNENNNKRREKKCGKISNEA